jgi:hypothetical protein
MLKEICPICGKKNNCLMKNNEFPENCWCHNVEVDQELVEYIPLEYQNISCVCQNCVELYNKDKILLKKYDLHNHSIFSDGTYTPEELVDRAIKNGLKGIAITDHDTIDGLERALKAGVENNFEVIPGIELSTNILGKEVHILGYFIDTEKQIFLENIKKIGLIRENRNKKILEKLSKYNINLTMEELKKEATGNIISKVHIANLLLKKGIVYSKEEAFRSYLGMNGVAYVEKNNFTPKMAVEMLKENGAIASLAHPLLYSKKISEIEKLILELIPLGLTGIESEYSKCSNKEKKEIRELGKKYNLISTGGSDFHGGNRPGIDIGAEGITYSEFLFMKNRAKLIKNR